MNAPATGLQLAYSDLTATISGVEFEWRAGCWACKDQWYETAPGGRVQVGLTQTTHGYRWMHERNLPPRRPFASPCQCPRCGQPNGMSVNHDRPDPLPKFAEQNKALRDLIGVAYAHLRATYPEQSGKADEALDDWARRHAWNAPSKKRGAR